MSTAITIKAARTLLQLPPRKKLKVSEVKSAWTKTMSAIKPAHPCKAAQKRVLCNARDLLLSTAVDRDAAEPPASVAAATPDPAPEVNSNILTITQDGRLLSGSNKPVGSCGTVAAAIAYCTAAASGAGA